MTITTNLMPCPFCGNAPTVTGPWEIGTSDTYEAVVECEHCGIQVSSAGGTVFNKGAAAAAATEKWNRRTPAPCLLQIAEPAEPVVTVTVTSGKPEQQSVEFNWKPGALPIGEHKLYLAPQAALAAVPLPLLLRDIARDLGITVPQACIALKPLGNYSTNSVVTAEMAWMLRDHFPAPAHPAEGVPEPVEVPSDEQAFDCHLSDCESAGIQYHGPSYERGFLTGKIVATDEAAALAAGMVSVTQVDANNYCRILAALGMEEEGDPVAEVQRLLAATPAAPAYRTEAEIVERTEAAARFLLGWKYGLEPESSDAKLRHSGNTKAQWAWDAACKLQEIITDSDAVNAAQEVDGAQEDAATPTAGVPAAAPDASDARDAAFEAVRNRLCGLQRYSFVLDDDGAVRRVQDRTGNWIEFDDAHELFDPVSVDAAIAAQAAAKGV